MVRSTEEEFRRRRRLREKYFEDPNYRRWSDIVPGGLSSRHYVSWRDDCLFDYYITSEASPFKLHLDGTSIIRFCGSSFPLMTDFLISPYDLSLSFSS